MSKGMPPPVTRKSSKKKLWEELECARAKIEQQQITLNELWAEAASSRYTIGIIRAAMTHHAPY